MQNHKQINDQLGILVNFTSKMMELVQSAEEHGISTKGKSRSELIGEINLAETGSPVPEPVFSEKDTRTERKPLVHGNS